MLNLSEIFKNKALNVSRLLAFGFTQKDKEYIYSTQILNNQFQMNVKITVAGMVSVNVWIWKATKNISLSTRQWLQGLLLVL